MAAWQAMEAAMRVRRVCKIMILRGFVGICAGLLDDLGQHPLQRRSLQANRRSLDGKCVRAKGFHLEAVALQLLGDAREDHHLRWL